MYVPSVSTKVAEFKTGPHQMSVVMGTSWDFYYISGSDEGYCISEKSINQTQY